MQTVEKAQHTPGPWVLNPEYLRVGERADRFRIHSEPAGYDPAYVQDIAEPFMGEVDESIVEKQEAIMEANARLIAAASEMLEALMAAYHYLEVNGLDDIVVGGKNLKAQIHEILDRVEAADA